MDTLLIGYDVEHMGDPAVTRAFLKTAAAVHRRTGTKATLFCVGRTVEASPEEFREAVATGLFDIQQHTYSHVLLKSVYQDDGTKKTFHKGGSLAQIIDELTRAKQAIYDVTGVWTVGLCGPYCYYRGLADRPDVLEVAHSLGITFTRTWGRDANDWQPVSHAIQPFRYSLQGFPSIVEIPLAGWQDCIWRERHGWGETEAYLEHLKRTLDEQAGTGRVWSYCQHDWSSMRNDPAMAVTERFIEHALKKGYEVDTHLGYREKFEATSPSS